MFKKIITGVVFMISQNLSSHPHTPSPSKYNADIEKEIIVDLTKNFSFTPQVQPLLLVIGGFQGAGKSSLIERIKKISHINVISNDVIRQSLFDRGVKYSPKFAKYVSTICETLVKISLNVSSHTVIDANAHSKRIEEIKKLLKDHNYIHKPIKIYLKTSAEVLKNRVKFRQPVAGAYQGTEQDLEAALRSVKINLEDYDLVINTDELNERGVFKIVKFYLSRNFSQIITKPKPH